MKRNEHDQQTQPRLLTQKAAAAYVGVSTPTFAKWVMEGILPGPAGITKMWDRKAIDLAIDKMGGIAPAPDVQVREDSFAAWKAKNEARKEREAKLLAQLKAPPRPR